MQIIGLIGVVILGAMGGLIGDRHISPDMENIEPDMTANFEDDGYMFLAEVMESDSVVYLVNEHGKFLDGHMFSGTRIRDLVRIQGVVGTGTEMAAVLTEDGDIYRIGVTSNDQLDITHWDTAPLGSEERPVSLAVTLDWSYVCIDTGTSALSSLAYRPEASSSWSVDPMMIDGNPVLCNDINTNLTGSGEIYGAFGPPGPTVIGKFSGGGTGTMYSTIDQYFDGALRVVGAEDFVYVVGNSATSSGQRDLIGFQPGGTVVETIEDVDLWHLSNHLFLWTAYTYDSIQVVTGSGEEEVAFGEENTTHNFTIHVLQFTHYFHID